MSKSAGPQKLRKITSLEQIRIKDFSSIQYRRDGFDVDDACIQSYNYKGSRLRCLFQSICDAGQHGVCICKISLNHNPKFMTSKVKGYSRLRQWYRTFKIIGFFYKMYMWNPCNFFWKLFFNSCSWQTAFCWENGCMVMVTSFHRINITSYY